MVRKMKQWICVAVVLGVAACGEEAPPVETQSPPVETQSRVEAGPHLVVIRMTDDMRFFPERASIAVGDTVVWINEGQMPHTATDRPGTAGVDEHNILPEGASAWDSGLLDPGQRFSQVFAVPGDYTYLCFLHEAAGMVGRLTVRETVA